MSVKSFLADPQFLRQIVHGHTAKPVTEKVRPRRIHDSLPHGHVLSASRWRFLCAVHSCCSAAAVPSDIRSIFHRFVRSLPERKCVTACCRSLAGEGINVTRAGTVETNIVYLVSTTSKIAFTTYRLITTVIASVETAMDFVAMRRSNPPSCCDAGAASGKFYCQLRSAK